MKKYFAYDALEREFTTHDTRHTTHDKKLNHKRKTVLMKFLILVLIMVSEMTLRMA